MTELEKLEAGLPYDFTDSEVDGRTLNAVLGCQRLNQISVLEITERQAAIRDLFGSVGENPNVLPVFNCNNGKNIHVGDDFLMNYNGTILDIRPVTIGNNVVVTAGVVVTKDVPNNCVVGGIPARFIKTIENDL